MSEKDSRLPPRSSSQPEDLEKKPESRSYDRVVYVMVRGDQEIYRGTREALADRFQRRDGEPLRRAIDEDRVAFISAPIWDLTCAADIAANRLRFDGDAERLSDAIQPGIAPAHWGRKP